MNEIWYKCTLVFTYSTPCSCKILTKLEFSRQIFEKPTYIKFHENPSSGTRVVPCRRTNRLKLIVTFCGFDNTSKNSSWSLFIFNYVLDTSVAMIQTHFSNIYFNIKNFETANPIIRAWIKKEVSAYYAITFYKKCLHYTSMHAIRVQLYLAWLQLLKKQTNKLYDSTPKFPKKLPYFLYR